MRLERTEGCSASTIAFDAPHRAVVLVNAQHRVLRANAAMQTLLRGLSGLRLREGELLGDGVGTKDARLGNKMQQLLDP